MYGDRNVTAMRRVCQRMPQLVIAMVSILVTCGSVPADDTVQKIVSALQDNDEGRRTWAIDQIWRRGLIEFAPEVEAAASARSAWVRSDAVQALGGLRVRNAASLILRALGDKDEQVREGAALALGTLGAPEYAPQLMALLGDGSPLVRAAAAETLGYLQYAPAGPALVAMLQDKDWAVVAGTLRGLAQLRTPGAEMQIVEVLRKTDNVQIQVPALNALGAFGLPDTAAAVEAALADKQDAVRGTALFTLLQIGHVTKPDSLLPFLRDPNPGTRGMALKVIGLARVEQLAKRVTDLVEDPDPGVGEIAADVAGRLNVEGSHAVLLAVLADSKKDAELRASAALALGRMKVVQGADLLGRVAEDENAIVRYGALRALGCLADMPGEEVLQRHRVHEASELCRVTAAVALARRGKFDEEDAARRVIMAFKGPGLTEAEVTRFFDLLSDLSPAVATRHLESLAKNEGLRFSLRATWALRELKKGDPERKDPKQGGAPDKPPQP